jgi:D-proline reductase (dithiol) PrdB
MPMPVDSFKYLPRILAAHYRMTEHHPELPIPWTPVPRPLSELVFGLVTSAGLFHLGVEPPFDLDRERQEPTWGDPSYRAIPADINKDELGVSHLHFNPQDVLEDVNILLPIHRFRGLLAEGSIGGLAKHAYSFMGYQGYPRNTKAWRERYGPEVAGRLKDEDVGCVLLTTA